MGFGDLPVELILHIFSQTPQHEKTLIARSCKAFYEAILPMLYHSIELDDATAVYQCCETLANDDNRYADLVRVWNIANASLWSLRRQQRLDLRGDFKRSIERMENLEYYHCPLYADVDILEIIMTKKHLRSLSIRIQSADPLKPEESASIMSLQPSFPYLHTLKVSCLGYRPLHPEYVHLIRHILTTHASQFTSLSLLAASGVSEREEFVRILVPPSLAFPSLKYLSVGCSALEPLTAGSIPNVRTLSIHFNDVGSDRQFAIDSDNFRSLEHFTGPSKLISEILRVPRPIKSLLLDGASFPTIFDAHRSSPAISMIQAMQWPDLVAIMPLFSRSTGPLHTLALTFMNLDIDDLPILAPHIPTVEVLLICLRENPTNIENFRTLGPRLFSKMPRLHTFLLSDTPFRQNHYFRFAQDYDLQEMLVNAWSQQSSSLHTVALGTRVIWKRGRDGWNKSAISQ